MRTCDIDGCDKKHLSRGLCKMHLQRLQRHGDVNVVKKPSRPKRTVRHCSIEECNGAYYASGLCSTHYAASRRAKNRPAKAPKALCDYPDCTRPSYRYGLCKRHDAELVDAPFYEPPRRQTKPKPIVGWVEMQSALHRTVTYTEGDEALTLQEILGARAMSQADYDALPVKDERTLYVIVPEGQA